tara:strand:- start:1573 stop:1806 length:234 start_codon:yes stop_codon:yes gene_type:complete
MIELELDGVLVARSVSPSIESATYDFEFTDVADLEVILQLLFDGRFGIRRCFERELNVTAADSHDGHVGKVVVERSS